MQTQPIESPLSCDRCAAELHPGKGEFYVVKIEAIADPTPPEFTEDDLRRDHRREFEQLLAQVQELSEREAMDQVFRRLTIFLCNRCYKEWIENPTG